MPPQNVSLRFNRLFVLLSFVIWYFFSSNNSSAQYLFVVLYNNYRAYNRYAFSYHLVEIEQNNNNNNNNKKNVSEGVSFKHVVENSNSWKRVGEF